MICRPALLLALLYTLPLGVLDGVAQTVVRTLPAKTPLAVNIDDHLPMKVGQAIRASLLYPVYSGETELLPQHTVLEGTIVALTPDKKRRLHARLRGDFTPFRIPVVHFSSVVLTDGRTLPISIGDATDGAPYLRIVPPPPNTGGLVKQTFERAKQVAQDQIQIVTAPDKGDRALQALYMNLPYHPQRVEKDTAWSFETTAPFTLPADATPLVLPDPEVAAKQKKKSVVEAPAPVEEGPPTWILQAFLTEPLDSSTAKIGETIHAEVAQPVFNKDKSVAVPVGSVLTGTVVAAKPARSFGRSGTLRFAFNQLTLPQGAPRSVQTTLVGVDAPGKIALDSEGQFKPAANNDLVIPLLLAALALHSLDTDGGDGAQFGKNAVGANGFGLVGVVLGAAGQSPYFAAGIGFYGTALTIYDRFIARGKQITFAHDTRVTVQTTNRRSAPLKPELH